MSVSDWLRRVDALSPRAAVGLGCGLGLLLLLFPGTAGGAAVSLLAVFGLLGLGLSGRVMLVSSPSSSVSDRTGQPAPVLPPPPAPQTQTWRVAGSVQFAMKRLDGGAFWMGSDDKDKDAYSDEQPRHRVTVSPFWIMPVGVTQRLFAAVMGRQAPAADQAELPVTEVSWFDAVEFCNALSTQLGLQPCYRRESDGWMWDRAADGFRLPTEAEREYATRAGSETAWCFGEDESQLGEFAWFSANSDMRPHPVGQKRANAWGLHDLHGNVWEWCWDYFSSYASSSVSDPIGPEDGRPHVLREGLRVPVVGPRVLRGGSFGNEPRNLRSADRDGFEPEFRGTNFGFRCVRSVSRQL